MIENEYQNLVIKRLTEIAQNTFSICIFLNVIIVLLIYICIK